MNSGTIASCLAAAVAIAAPLPAAAATAAVMNAPTTNYSESMSRLQDAAQRLRDAVHAMARESAGPGRDAAMRTAEEALIDTQRAMIALPPELRTGAAPGAHNYTESMERLQQAAQKLRESVQAMAQREPSARRDRAARKAREALLETQEAMADLPASLRVGNATASAPGHVTPEYAARLRSMPRHDAESLDNPIEHRSGIEYTAGGVGLEDQQRLDRLAQARDYNLKAVFALNTGNYVADVDVVLQDQSGRRLIDYEADGPYFVAKVPPGRYTLVATYEGEPQRHAVSIGDHGARTEYFHWNAHPTTNLLAR